MNRLIWRNTWLEIRRYRSWNTFHFGLCAYGTGDFAKKKQTIVHFYLGFLSVSTILTHGDKQQ